MNSYKNSAIDCHTVGISVAFDTAKLQKRKQREQLNITKSEELVKEKSKTPIVNGIIFDIENCSKGEKKNIRINTKLAK